ncbi:MAG: ISNCY family transposase, partial [Proteobacteria bacterium]|nr:ISNCY family transposase [Pseudomonadota bacterium]
KLREGYELSFRYESLRRLLIDRGFHEPKKKRRVYRRRRRMPMAGMLVQMDSSQHRWIDSVKEMWWLVTMVDDGDNFTYGEFHSSDNMWANMKVLRNYIEQRGIFMALYTDKASHFKTTRLGGLHYKVDIEQKETQIERALNELGITLITANSPQAKGRIERKFRFFQDRLIKEMKLRGIDNYDKANKFLKEEFIVWCNNKYMIPSESVYKPLTKDKELELIFSLKHPRIVKKDNTVQYSKRVYQLFPTNGRNSYAGKWVEICELMDGRIEILCEGKRVNYKEIRGSEDERKTHKGDEILNLRINDDTRPVLHKNEKITNAM